MANTNATEFGDDLYFVVKREIDGTTVRYIEYMSARFLQYTPTAEQAFFVDCGITITSPSSTNISGLDHLEGKDVAVLADGNVVTGLTVTLGCIDLPYLPDVVHIGLPITAELETLNLEIQANGTTAQDKRRSIDSVMVRLENTREVWIGVDDDHLEEIAFRQDENYDEATNLFSGDKTVQIDGTNGKEAKIFIKNVDPLPITVLAIIPRTSIGGI